MEGSIALTGTTPSLPEGVSCAAKLVTQTLPTTQQACEPPGHLPVEKTCPMRSNGMRALVSAGGSNADLFKLNGHERSFVVFICKGLQCWGLVTGAQVRCEARGFLGDRTDTADLIEYEVTTGTRYSETNLEGAPKCKPNAVLVLERHFTNKSAHTSMKT